MKYSQLINKINSFYRLAAAPEFLKLRTTRDRKMLGGELWFGANMAQVNNDMNNFAILDNKIVSALKNLERNYGVVGSSDIADINSYYLSHPKTQNLIRFICNTYNNNFPGRDAYAVAQHLENEGQLDPSSELFKTLFLY